MSYGETGVAVSAEQIARVQDVLVALGVGLFITLIYCVVFFSKRRQAPATGSIGYVIFESVAICGVFQILYRMVRLEYVEKLNPEEHLYIGVGAIMVLFILGKKMLGMFKEARSTARGTDDGPRTEDDGG